jgi:hypothetical protein
MTRSIDGKDNFCKVYNHGVYRLAHFYLSMEDRSPNRWQHRLK